MRPVTTPDLIQSRTRKSSHAEQSAPSTNAHGAAPITFFLSKTSNIDEIDKKLVGLPGSAFQQMLPPKEPLGNAAETFGITPNEDHGQETAGDSRRRSTIRNIGSFVSRRSSPSNGAAASTRAEEESLTPPQPPTTEPSLPSSPKSMSTRSWRKSDEESASDEIGSQALLFCGEEEPEPSSSIADSAPELIMPSIRMPSRRPFTERGKRIGRFKVLVAGGKGRDGRSPFSSVTLTVRRYREDVTAQVYRAALRRHRSCGPPNT